jgi:response regulator of citrate/malate metabolism
VVVGDTIISEQGLVAIIGRDPGYHVCGAAHSFEEANKLVRQHRPDVLLIEPFLENRDAVRWIKISPWNFRVFASLWYQDNPN